MGHEECERHLHRGLRGFPSVVIALILLLMLSHSSSQILASTNGSRISCFVIGIVNPAHCPFTAYFEIDPLFRYTLDPVPPYLSNEEKMKLDRVYFPRTRDILIREYDMIIFSDPWIEHFTTKRLHDLDYALREGGVGSFATFSLPWDMVWVPTVLYYTVPVSEYGDYRRVPYRVTFRREREPVFTPFIELGMEKIIGDGYHVLVPRPGSTVWADVQPSKTPWLVSWRPGGRNAGMQWVCTGTFDAAWWGVGDWWETGGVKGIDRNPYAIDLATNLILYSLDRQLIGDVHARREARRLLHTFQTQKLLIMSMLEWADSFGADIFPLFKVLTELESQAENATRYYLDQDYSVVVSSMESISGEVTQAAEYAVRLKNQAMFWIFISEWVAIASVATIAGVSIWILMIRRRKYRPVPSTKLRLSY